MTARKRVASHRSHDNNVRVNQTMPGTTTHTREGIEIQTMKVPAAFQGFVDFVREQGVVGLGVGFVVGTAANSLIKSVVTNILNPFIGLLIGGIDLTQKSVCLKATGKVCKDTLSYGQVISDLITFVAILVVVYFVIKSMRLEKLDKPKAK